MKNRVGFIGVGNMGFPMALNLIRSGYEVTVFDKDQKRVAELVKEGAKPGTSAKEVISPGCTVISMVSNDEALKEVFLEEQGLVSFLTSEETHLCMCTVSPDTIKLLSEAHQKFGTHFVSAPVLGRPDAAASKKLWVFLSGEVHLKERVKPILERLSQGIYDFGSDVCASSVVKIVANFLIISAIETMGEASALLKKKGLDPSVFGKMMTETLFACPAYRYHADNIAEQKFTPAGFKLSLGMKDVQLLRETAQEVNVPMPIASLLHDRFLSALAKGRGDLDWAAITANVLEEAGLEKEG